MAVIISKIKGPSPLALSLQRDVQSWPAEGGFGGRWPGSHGCGPKWLPLCNWEWSHRFLRGKCAVIEALGSRALPLGSLLCDLELVT